MSEKAKTNEDAVICGKCGKAPPPKTTAVATVTCPWCGAVAQWIGDPASWHRSQPTEEPIEKEREQTP